MHRRVSREPRWRTWPSALEPFTAPTARERGDWDDCLTSPGESTLDRTGEMSVEVWP